MKKIVKILLIIAVPCLIAWVVSTFFYQCLVIQGQSMRPAYRHMQFVLVDKQVKEYQQGDVVLLYSKGLKQKIVKRIAACPGDTIVIRDQTLYVNGRQSDVFLPGSVTYDGILSNEIQLKDGEYIVLGDNLRESIDSRYEEVGIVQGKDIKGKLMW